MPGEPGPAAPGGSSMRYGEPWADPLEARDPVRRIRGRLPAGVTVWTSDDGAGGCEGLTVSSVVLAQGDPPRLAGLVGPDTNLAESLEPGARFVVHLLSDSHRRLAQHFAGQLPAPEELLGIEPTSHGPALTVVADRLMCTVARQRPFGWPALVEATVDEVALGDASPPLCWYRGRFHRLGPG